MIGVVYLLDIDWQARSAVYAISIYEEKNKGKGIGKLATLKILEHAFNDLNLNRIQLEVLDYNEKAINFYNKIGFKKEGVIRESIYKNGEYHNQILMSILKKEFVK
jgi:RimJ/RimL family protein N-acetyltransferase